MRRQLKFQLHGRHPTKTWPILAQTMSTTRIIDICELGLLFTRWLHMLKRLLGFQIHHLWLDKKFYEKDNLPKIQDSRASSGDKEISSWHVLLHFLWKILPVSFTFGLTFGSLYFFEVKCCAHGRVFMITSSDFQR